jgi:hypothetical protein
VAHRQPAAATRGVTGWKSAAAADLLFCDVMTVVLANVAAPVLSVVKVFPVLALCAALVAATVRGASARYGCSLAWCRRLLMHPRAALKQPPLILYLVM